MEHRDQNRFALCRHHTTPRTSKMDSRMFAQEYGSGMVPRLLTIVEPTVVWHHMHSLGQPPEATHCFGQFFNSKDLSKLAAHGVYEGSYWKLLAEADELRKTLLRLARAPEAAEIPELRLPEGPNVPAWDVFAPALQPTLDNAPVPPLVLPAFAPPPLQARSLKFGSPLDWQAVRCFYQVLHTVRVLRWSSCDCVVPDVRFLEPWPTFSETPASAPVYVTQEDMKPYSEVILTSGVSYYVSPAQQGTVHACRQNRSSLRHPCKGCHSFLQQLERTHCQSMWHQLARK